jgi:hypothetical protein
MGVIVISLATPHSAGENFGCTGEHLGVLATSLGALATSLGERTTNHGAPATCVGAPQLPVVKFRKNNFFFGNPAGAAGSHGFYLSFNVC